MQQGEFITEDNLTLNILPVTYISLFHEQVHLIFKMTDLVAHFISFEGI